MEKKIVFPEHFWWGAATSGPQTEGSTDKTPRRFHRLTHDRNKIWYYTYLREQY